MTPEWYLPLAAPAAPPRASAAAPSSTANLASSSEMAAGCGDGGRGGGAGSAGGETKPACVGGEAERAAAETRRWAEGVAEGWRVAAALSKGEWRGGGGGGGEGRRRRRGFTCYQNAEKRESRRDERVTQRRISLAEGEGVCLQSTPELWLVAVRGCWFNREFLYDLDPALTHAVCRR